MYDVKSDLKHNMELVGKGYHNTMLGIVKLEVYVLMVKLYMDIYILLSILKTSLNSP